MNASFQIIHPELNGRNAIILPSKSAGPVLGKDRTSEACRIVETQLVLSCFEISSVGHIVVFPDGTSCGFNQSRVQII